jgi:hypothetical protein
MNTKKVPVSNSESKEIQLKKDIEYQGVTNKVRFPSEVEKKIVELESTWKAIAWFLSATDDVLQVQVHGDIQIIFNLPIKVEKISLRIKYTTRKLFQLINLEREVGNIYFIEDLFSFVFWRKYWH